MVEIETNKVKVPIDCDLTIVTLRHMVELFRSEFRNSPPHGLTITVGAAQIFTAVGLMLWKIDEQIERELDVKIYFDYNKDFKDYYWEISAIHNGKRCIVYTDGA